MSTWIDVREELPRPGRLVLLLYVGSKHGRPAKARKRQVLFGVHAGGEFRFFDTRGTSNHRLSERVTHWHPLPKKPPR